MDSFVIAVSRYRRRRYDEAIQLCDKMLDMNALDQSAWVLKCSSLIRKFYVDDIEIDEQGVGDLLMDENAINTVARPGTSIQRPNTKAGQGVRPMSKQGRLQTGFARPVTNRQGGNAETVLKTARQADRLGTARPMTSGGRYIRLGTASLQSIGDQFIQSDKLDLKKLAAKPVISRVLCDYLLYVEHNPKKALQLAAEATQFNKFDDWWWKERLGKAYFMLGLYREADKQFQIYLRFDQPTAAIELYKKALLKFPHEASFVIGIARVYDLLNEPDKSIDYYRDCLDIDNFNLESVASIAAHHFYIDQPEVSLQFYKRLIQLGVRTTEVWNNLGLCCFYAGQYDLFYSCFERALAISEDSNRADVWYNISHVFINLGDVGTAYQCLKLCVCIDPKHEEAHNNIGVLQTKRGEFDKARASYQNSMESSEHLYEPVYNKALLLYNQQEFSGCYTLVQKALKVYPEHFESLELQKQVQRILQQI